MTHHLRHAVRSHSTSSTGSNSSNYSSNPNSPLTKNGQYRIIVMGAAGVGKTCIISQFLYETFHTQYKPTVEELHRGEYEINGLPLTLDILDTSGEYEFPAMRQLSISTGDAFILVYSVTDEASFEVVKKLREQILVQKNDEFTPIVIVGNKADCIKERQIPRETAETTVNIDWDNGFVEGSAKNNINIVGIFQELLTQCNVPYALSPAVRRRRRESNPVVTTHKKDGKTVRQRAKRNSCSIC